MKISSSHILTLISNLQKLCLDMIEQLLRALRKLPARAHPAKILIRPAAWTELQSDPRAGPYLKGETFQGIRMVLDPTLPKGVEFQISWD